MIVAIVLLLVASSISQSAVAVAANRNQISSAATTTEQMHRSESLHLRVVRSNEEKLDQFRSEVTRSGDLFVSSEIPMPGESTEQAILRIGREPGVLSVEVERHLHPTTDDTYWGDQWALDGVSEGAIGPSGAWGVTTGESAVVVAVIDTGIVSHPDLDAAVRRDWGVDMISSASSARDGDGRDLDATDMGDRNQSRNSSWHGTHVAGIIAAQQGNGLGIAGVAPGVSIMPIRVLGSDGGEWVDVADAVRWAAGLGTSSDGSAWGLWGLPENSHPADIINMSLGGRGACDQSNVVGQAISAATTVGVLVVVAAGNDSADAIGYTPAGCPDAFTVAAVGRSGDRAPYSNYGASVDIAAPGGSTSGGGIISTVDTGTLTSEGPGYAYYKGTSMAAPFVSGIAALIKSVYPALTPLAIERRIQKKSKPFVGLTSSFLLGCSSSPTNSERMEQCGSGIAQVGEWIAKLGQTITTSTPNEITLGDVPVDLGASSDSGLPVTIVSVTESTCEVAGERVQPLSVGDCIIEAIQDGDATYERSAERSTIAIRKADRLAQVVTLSSPQSLTYGSPPIDVEVASDRGLPVSLTSATPMVCTVSGLTLAVIDVGTCTVVARQVGDSDYLPAPTVTRSTSINRASQTLYLSVPTGALVGESPKNASRTTFDQISAISSGGYNTCALKENGTVWCWGFNNYGQLGVGTRENSSRPLMILGLKNIVQISLKGEVGCALNGSGLVFCWGFNGYGQLGDGSTMDRRSPIQVTGLTDVSTIAVGNWHTCAVKVDGTVWCWGSNSFGQVGEQVTAERNRLHPAQVLGLAGVDSISLGLFHTCAVKLDATVWCWGRNNYGQLGDGTTVNSFSPVQVAPLEGISAISARWDTTCAITTGETVWCWGSNSSRGLNLGGIEYSSVPISVMGLANVSKIQGTCAVKDDGSAWCWGGQDYDERAYVEGDVPWSRELGLRRLLLPPVYSTAHGPWTSCALTLDRTVMCWGYGAYGGLGDGTMQRRQRADYVSLLDAELVSLTSGVCGVVDGKIEIRSVGTCTIRAQQFGSARYLPAVPAVRSFSVGKGTQQITFSQIADAPVTATSILLSTSGDGKLSVVQLSTGPSSTCALTSDKKVSCFGVIERGAGNRTTDPTKTSVVPQVVPGLTGVKAISSGYHSCVIRADDTVWCWGANFDRQLGNGSTAYGYRPSQVPGLTDVASISVGLYHSCALKADRTVWCWGLNYDGELGDGTSTERYLPVQVAGVSDVIALSAGAFHTCVVLGSGRITCWGHNGFGQLGNGTTGGDHSPVAVQDDGPFLSVSAGLYHTCAVKTDRSAWCWGYNMNGELGIGSTTSQTLPAEVSGLGSVRSLSAGQNHSCATMLDGSAWCWGNNSRGALGRIGDYSLSPVQVSGLSGVQSMHASYEHTCALKTEGSAWCWGAHLEGQIGSSPTKVDTRLPSRVNGLTGHASSNRGLGLTFTTSTPTVCSILGSRIKLLAVGSCTVTARQSGNAQYSAAANVSHTFNVLGRARFTVAPAVLGRAGVGEVLNAGSWQVAGGTGGSVQWYSCSSSGIARASQPAGCSAIKGAVSSSHIATSGDRGKYLRVKVTVTNSFGSTAYFSATTTKVGLPPRNTLAPAIRGTSRVGQLLYGTAGRWSGSPAPILKFQWYRCDSSASNATSSMVVTGCSAIPKATNSTYRLAVRDVGSFIRLRVSATSSAGLRWHWSAPTVRQVTP